MYTIYQCSPKAEPLLEGLFDKPEDRKQLEVADGRTDIKYPFAKLAIGQCFIVGIDDSVPGQDNRLRVAASKHGKRLGRRFTVIRHDEYKCYELARIS